MSVGACMKERGIGKHTDHRPAQMTCSTLIACGPISVSNVTLANTANLPAHVSHIWILCLPGRMIVYACVFVSLCVSEYVCVCALRVCVCVYVFLVITL